MEFVDKANENDSRFPREFRYDVIHDKPMFRIVPCQNDKGGFDKYLVLRIFDQEQELLDEDGKVNYHIEPKNEVVLSKINDYKENQNNFLNSSALNDIENMYEQIGVEISKIIDDYDMTDKEKIIAISKQMSRVAKGEYKTRQRGNESIEFCPTEDGKKFDEQRDMGYEIPGKEYFKDGQKLVEKHYVMQQDVIFDKNCYRKELRTGEFVVDEYSKKMTQDLNKRKSLSESLSSQVVPENERPYITNIRKDERNSQIKEKDIS